jgi:SanA protein
MYALWLKRWFRYPATALFAALCWVLICNLAINVLAEGKLYDNPADVPRMRVALVLGTSERMAGGKRNPFFENRIATAAQLYKEGRVQVLLVSGDNRTHYYDEPAMMRRALLRLGIPSYAIWQDDGGTRTIDSIRRCRRVFGQTECVIVSQRFHNQRALFLARAVGLQAVACNAAPVPGWAGIRLELREVGAKVLALWDLAGVTFFERGAGA